MRHKIFLTIEAIILIIAGFMAWYADKRMGLIRHFIYDAYRYEQWVEGNFFEAVLMIGVLLLLIIGISAAYRKRDNLSKIGLVHLILLIGLCVLLLLLFTPLKEAVAIYPYLNFLLPIFALGNLVALLTSLSGIK